MKLIERHYKTILIVLMAMAAFAKPLLCDGRFISTKFNHKIMTVEELIKVLEKLPKSKIVVLTAELIVIK